jgi:hypothetical protein
VPSSASAALTVQSSACRKLVALQRYLDADAAVRETEAAIAALQASVGGADLSADNDALERLAAELRTAEHQAANKQGELSGLGTVRRARVYKHREFSLLGCAVALAFRALDFWLGLRYLYYCNDTCNRMCQCFSSVLENDATRAAHR